MKEETADKTYCLDPWIHHAWNPVYIIRIPNTTAKFPLKKKKKKNKQKAKRSFMFSLFHQKDTQ